jgi:hypothetical protein
MPDSFEKIVDELSVHILSFLEPQDLTKIAQVSTKLRRLADDRQLWLKLLEKETTYQVKETEIPKLIYQKLFDLSKKTPEELLPLAVDDITIELIITTPILLTNLCKLNYHQLKKLIISYRQILKNENASSVSKIKTLKIIELIFVIPQLHFACGLSMIKNLINLCSSMGFKPYNELSVLNKIENQVFYDLLHTAIENNRPSTDQVGVYVIFTSALKKLDEKIPALFIDFPKYAKLLTGKSKLLPYFSEDDFYKLLQAIAQAALDNINLAKDEDNKPFTRHRKCETRSKTLILGSGDKAEDQYKTGYKLLLKAEDQYTTGYKLLLKLAQRNHPLNSQKLNIIINLQKKYLQELNTFAVHFEENPYTNLTDMFRNMSQILDKDREENDEPSNDVLDSHASMCEDYEKSCELFLNLAKTSPELDESQLDELLQAQEKFLIKFNTYLINFGQHEPKPIFQKTL